jgi:hypothetical protein
MALAFEIVLGVLILASFFVAYMSSRTWPIYQVILAEFVFLAAIAFMYLGARTLATHNSWRKLVKDRDAQLADLERQIKETREGGPVDPTSGKATPPGVRQLRDQLHRLAIDRGGVMYDVAVDGVKDGSVQLTLKTPDHGLVANTVLFAFDQGNLDEGGRYRGEFKVTTAAENSPAIQVVPNLPLSEAQAKALAATKGPWTLYTTMPIDDAGLFAAMDEATRTALVPKDHLAEYAKADRTLRDYEQFFHASFVQRSLLADGIAKLASNIARTESDVKEATGEIAYRQTEMANLQGDLEKFQHEQQAIATYSQTLSRQYEQLRESLKATFVSARGRAAELTTEQLRAAAEIDQRSAAAPQR